MYYHGRRAAELGADAFDISAENLLTGGRNLSVDEDAEPSTLKLLLLRCSCSISIPIDATCAKAFKLGNLVSGELDAEEDEGHETDVGGDGVLSGASLFLLICADA